MIFFYLVVASLDEIWLVPRRQQSYIVLLQYAYCNKFTPDFKKITKSLICRFSGLTAEDLHGVRTRLRDVQAVLLMKFKASDILIGHSLESDLKALKVGNMGINLQSTLEQCVSDSSRIFMQTRIEFFLSFLWIRIPRWEFCIALWTSSIRNLQRFVAVNWTSL